LFPWGGRMNSHKKEAGKDIFYRVLTDLPGHESTLNAWGKNVNPVRQERIWFGENNKKNRGSANCRWGTNCIVRKESAKTAAKTLIKAGGRGPQREVFYPRHLLSVKNTK